MPIDQDTLGAAIKGVRMTRGLTQSQLAKRLGFSSGGIALIEQGKRAVSMATLNSIANVLEVPPGCLAILGSRTGGKSKPLADFIESLKQVISKLIFAQSKMAADGEKNDQNKRSIKKVAKARSHGLSEVAQSVGSIVELSSKGKAARLGSRKVIAGR